MPNMSKGFPVGALTYIRCTTCGGALSLEMHSTQTCIQEGVVICAMCKQTYAIFEGILLMDGDISDTHMQSEITVRDKDAHVYDARLDKRYYKEIEPTLQFIGPTHHKIILELGCGTGRFTKFFGNASLVIAVDFSRESLRILSQREIDAPVACVCADATSFLCSKDSVDLVVSTQVVEHIPHVSYRTALYAHVQSFLKKNGVVVLSAYHFDIRRRIKKQSKTGFHAGGIFYTYFTKADIVREIGERLTVQAWKYIDITLPLEVRFGIDKRLGGYISRVMSYIPFVRLLSHIILVKAYKHENV